MNVLPSVPDMTGWIGNVAKSCIFSLASGIGIICMLVYMLSIIAMAMEGKEEFHAKKFAIGSLITYFLSKAIIYFFV